MLSSRIFWSAADFRAISVCWSSFRSSCAVAAFSASVSEAIASAICCVCSCSIRMSATIC
jgi:hypothetical protein